MAYIKSILWLFGTSALGYTLLLITSPDEKIVADKYADTHTSETIKKRLAALETIRLAAENKNPMYRQNKKQIDSDLQKK